MSIDGLKNAPYVYNGILYSHKKVENPATGDNRTDILI